MNRGRFHNMLEMTDKAHANGLTMGWYFNNCICRDSKCADRKCYQGDVHATFQYGFDAVKLDGCGAQMNLDLWSDLLAETGKPIMIESKDLVYRYTSNMNTLHSSIYVG